MTRKSICFWTVAFALSLLIPFLNGQTTFGSIVGTATDSSGAVVANVRVTAINEATGVSLTVSTSSVGAYSFTALIPGPYRVHAELPGFRPVDVRGIQLQVDQTARYDLLMQVGQISEKVEVDAKLATLATDTSDVGQVIENREIVDLPLNGRKYLELATLTNGVLDVAGTASDSAGPLFSSEGNRPLGNSYLVGGLDTRIQRNYTYGVSLSVDAIGEFKILQNSYAAEYGRGSSVVTSTIKSGTNAVHGSLFEFVRNDAFDARYSYNFTNATTPLRQNQFGGSIGGPIRHNKTFFFANYEGDRLRQTTISYGVMPQPAIFSGNMSSTGKVKDPDTGLAFPGNIIPASRVSQFAKGGEQYFRAPTGSPLPNYNYVAPTGVRQRSDQGTVHIDHNVSNNIRIDGFFTTYDQESYTPALNAFSGTLATLRALPVFAIQYTHILTPSLLVNVRFGRYKSVIYSGQESSTSTNVAAEEFGLKNCLPQTYAFGPPGISINGIPHAGVTEWQPTGATDVNHQWNGVLTWTKGRHTSKFGADLRWLRYDDLGYAIQNGSFYFNGQYTGVALGDYVLGLPNLVRADLRGLGGFSYATRQGEFSGFAQDDVKITPHLTINAGIRYELVEFPREIHNELSNWNFAKHAMDLAGRDLPSRLLPTPKTNFAPRIGLAYNPPWLKKTVFRGGFGMSYGNFRQYEAGLQHYQPPYVNEISLSNNVPKPTYTTADLFAAPILDLTNADLSDVVVNYLHDKALPLVYQWNFNIQRELPGNFLLQVGYVGNKGVHQQNRYDANAPVPYDPKNPRTINDRRPFQKLGEVIGTTSSSYSNYNALDVHVERRFSRGLSVLGNYTWGKAMDLYNRNNYWVMMIDNVRFNYGPTGRPQRSVISFLYELPVGPGKPFLNRGGLLLGRVIGGWQANGIVTLQSGQWLTISSNVNSGMGNPMTNKADATGKPAILPHDKRSPAHWFNTAAFVDPPYTRYGNSGEGVVVGPGAQNFNLSFFKNARITERSRLQFRVEGFNALNHVNFGNPVINVSSRATFGTITSAATARIMQFGMKLLF